MAATDSCVSGSALSPNFASVTPSTLSSSGTFSVFAYTPGLYTVCYQLSPFFFFFFTQLPCFRKIRCDNHSHSVRNVYYVYEYECEEEEEEEDKWRIMTDWFCVLLLIRTQDCCCHWCFYIDFAEYVDSVRRSSSASDSARCKWFCANEHGYCQHSWQRHGVVC